MAETDSGSSDDARFGGDYEAIKKFSTNEKMIATRCIGPVKKRANVLNKAWCVNIFTQLTREVQRRANALHFTFTFSSGVNQPNQLVPQRVVRGQALACYVSEGGAGVIPNGLPFGVIPALYFMYFRHRSAPTAPAKLCD